MTEAFRLAVRGDGIATLVFDHPGRKVNVFDRNTLRELDGLVGELERRSDLRILVLLSGKEDSFVAGLDVAEIARVEDPAEAAAGSRRGQELLDRWAALPFPTVAAVRGGCLGGGTELGLASTYLLVSDRPSLRIGLPETRLGILPGWGGCTRLPRRLGLVAALDLILPGKTVSGPRAYRLGLADALLPEATFLRHVLDFSLAHRDQPARHRRKRAPGRKLLEGNPVGRKLVLERARRSTLERTGGRYPAPLRAIEVIRTGIEQGEEAGLAAEVRAIAELATSPQCKSLLHLFFLREAAKKWPQPLSGVPAAPVRSLAVVGAGTMGGGISQLAAEKAEVPVRLHDIAVQGLATGLEHAARRFRSRTERRRLSRPEARRRLALLRPSLDLTGFDRVDLVIEAVVERLAVKQEVFARLAERVGEDTILATNTSSLPIDRIADGVTRPERVVGMHFFNPVHRMPLVEVVVGERTASRTAATVVDLARRLGKTPILVRDAPGFLVNRLLAVYLLEALRLLEEGHDIASVDGEMTDWGMPMGPFALLDEVGIDVAFEVAHVLQKAFGDRLPIPSWGDRLLEAGRLGSKSGAGFYRYRGGERRRPDPEVYRLLGLPGDGGRKPRKARERVLRMILPMVNEAARCLDEGVVSTPDLLDLAMVFGTGFPPFRGGLCRWADQRGLRRTAADLEELARQVAPRFIPASPLLAAAGSGGFYAHSWQGGGPSWNGG